MICCAVFSFPCCALNCCRANCDLPVSGLCRVWCAVVSAAQRDMTVVRLAPVTEPAEQKLRDETNVEDAPMGSVGFALLPLYTVFVLWKPRNRVKSQAMLAIAAVLSVGLAIGVSHGIAASELVHLLEPPLRVVLPSLRD